MEATYYREYMHIWLNKYFGGVSYRRLYIFNSCLMSFATFKILFFFVIDLDTAVMAWM